MKHINALTNSKSWTCRSILNTKTYGALLLVAAAATAAWAQTSPLYIIYAPLAQPALGTTYIYQNGQQIGSFTHSKVGETAIAIAGGTVRQTSYTYGAGTEYTLAGVPTGVSYPGADQVYDATSDGNFIYGWNWETASLEQFDLNWNYLTTPFSLGPAYSESFTGIAYDTQTGSVWLCPWGVAQQGTLYNYTLAGQLLGTLNLANNAAVGGGLAYDPADNTLWFYSWTDQRYEQYAKNGTLLSTLSGLTRVFGAEFAPLATETIQIDVRPDSDRNPVNLKSQGVLPVAVLSSASFDAQTVDVSSLALGPSGAAPLSKPKPQFEDVNGDGRRDLLLHFRTTDLGLSPGDTKVVLTGQTLQGQQISGEDSVVIVP